jgi:RNA-directed DNA polymerase
MSTSTETMTDAETRPDGCMTDGTDWTAIDWRTVEIAVFKLQKRIFRTSMRGDVVHVHKLQRLLMRSRSARLLAVRKVTQDNRGKRTAGVDGVSNLSPAERLELANHLTLRDTSQPLRRIWIPKPGSTEKRALGIPTLRVRAEQALAKLALEPEWEAHFEPNSYGFRPGRSAHDAIGAIFGTICGKPRYVLDADIRKCFDRISHPALLQKLNTFPSLRRAVRAWLKAGVMEGGELFPTDEGTPQGGVISPLLANIALHGLETEVVASFPERLKGENWRPQVVRYADDFVVLHHDRAVIEKIKEIVTKWLNGMGLELKPEKTRIAHTLRPQQGGAGFDFLGFEVRQYPVGKTHSARSSTGKLLGFKTLIKPSKEAQKRHLGNLATIVHAHQADAQFALIHHLNPVVHGWANYYRHVVSKDVFCRLDHQLHNKLQRWARRRHPGKSHTWVVQRYWQSHGKRHWVFASIDRVPLHTHADTPIERHAKVQGTRSPFDGDWIYWSLRCGHYPDISRTVSYLLRQQKGRCPLCGLYFKPGDVLERDHTVPRSQGGTDALTNRQLLHGHCHDRKTAADRVAVQVSVTRTG